MKKKRDHGVRGRIARFLAGCLTLTMFAWPTPLHAQAVTGTILGTVRDGSGAAVPGATVTLTNTGTGLVRTAVTDSAGEYSAPQIPTGAYTVSAELSGFKKVSVANARVGVD